MKTQISGSPFIGTNAPATHFQCPDDIPAHRYQHCACTTDWQDALETLSNAMEYQSDLYLSDYLAYDAWAIALLEGATLQVTRESC